MSQDLSRLPLSHPDLAIVVTDAKTRAADPDAIIDHCPWDLSESYLGCCRRDLWRAVFHKERERLVVIAAGILAGEEIAALFGHPLRTDPEIDLARRFAERKSLLASIRTEIAL